MALNSEGRVQQSGLADHRRRPPCRPKVCARRPLGHAKRKAGRFLRARQGKVAAEIVCRIPAITISTLPPTNPELSSGRLKTSAKDGAIEIEPLRMACGIEMGKRQSLARLFALSLKTL